MTVVIGVLTFAAILTGIAVTILLAIAALVGILLPLFARGSDGNDSPAASQASTRRDAPPARRSGVRLTH
jgi:hypothetical protein